MRRFATGRQTASLGNNALILCPAYDTMIPVLRGYSVTTGASVQKLYACSPLGILETKSFTPAGASTTEMHGLVVGEFGSPGGSIDVAVDDTYTYDTSAASPPPFAKLDTTTFLLSDVDGTNSDPMGHMGVHISSVAIANGETITNAKIQVTTGASGSGGSAVDYTVYIQNVDNATAPTIFGDISDKLQTETVNGQVFSSTTTYEFDITSGLQTVVNRAGWASGNGVNVYIELDAHAGAGSPNTVDFDKEGDANEPRLIVTYGGGSSVTAGDYVVVLNQFGAYEVLEVSSVSGNKFTWDTGPANDLLVRSLVYPMFNPVESGTPTATQPGFVLPANGTTTREAWLQGGRDSQVSGVDEAVRGEGTPMLVVVTNDNNDLDQVEYCDFAWIGRENDAAVRIAEAVASSGGSAGTGEFGKAGPPPVFP